MRLAVVILNFRTANLTIDCLESLSAQIEAGRDVAIVVDNGSGDGSAERIETAIAERRWSAWTSVIQSRTNVGFPAGCNIGVRAIEADAYLLLNNDTIVRPGAVSSLLRALHEHPEAGIISPQLEWPDGIPQVNCRRYLSPVSEFLSAAATGPLARLLQRYGVSLPFSNRPCEPEWLCFASALIRREVIQQVGLLDEGYFNYFDDVDYCRRARRAGWRVLSWPEARVVHLVGASQSVESDRAARRRRPAYYYASRARYFAKFYGRLGLGLANLLWTTGRAISKARELVGNKKPHVCEKEWRDIWTNFWNPLKPPARPEVVRPVPSVAP